MASLDFSVDDYVAELILCARYGELDDMKSLFKSVEEFPRCCPLRIPAADFANAQDAEGNTALHMSAANGHEGILVSCLLYLMYSSRVEILRYLVEDKKADVNRVNRQGNTPLHWAVVNQRTEIVKLLLNYQADRNVRKN